MPVGIKIKTITNLKVVFLAECDKLGRPSFITDSTPPI